MKIFTFTTVEATISGAQAVAFIWTADGERLPVAFFSDTEHGAKTAAQAHWNAELAVATKRAEAQIARRAAKKKAGKGPQTDVSDDEELEVV